MVIIKSILTYSGTKVLLNQFTYNPSSKQVNLIAGRQIIIISIISENQYAVDLESIVGDNTSTVITIQANSYYAILNQSASIQFLDGYNNSIFYLKDTSDLNTDVDSAFPLIFYPASKITFDFS